MILNLTQHVATPDQKAAGVIDLPEELRDRLQGLLTFDCITETQPHFLEWRARDIAELVNAFEPSDTPIPKAMIGGAPFFMSFVEAALKEISVQPLYAFSTRDVVETTSEDGQVTKKAVFRHKGFVSVRMDLISVPMELPVHAA